MRGQWLTNSDLVAGVAPGRCSIHEVAIAGAALQAKVVQMMTSSQVKGVLRSNCRADISLPNSPEVHAIQMERNTECPMRICAW